VDAKGVKAPTTFGPKIMSRYFENCTSFISQFWKDTMAVWEHVASFLTQRTCGFNNKSS